ncbi:MAG: hypothetical protein ACRDRZ_17080 [Pseudonocardiaceae bacterium]
MTRLAQDATPDPSVWGWNLGFAIAIVVIAVVVVLVARILALAARIGQQAPMINEALQRAYHDTLPLAELRTTINHAQVIIAGLQRGRARLGG